MKCTVIFDEMRDEEVIIYAQKSSALIDELVSMVDGSNQTLNGYLRGEIVKIDVKDVYYFTVEENKLYAIIESEKYLLKTRLYTLEAMLDKKFVKINKSSIANITKIKKFDASIYGTLKVVFKNGHIDYVSRRNVKTVKERLGL